MTGLVPTRLLVTDRIKRRIISASSLLNDTEQAEKVTELPAIQVQTQAKPKRMIDLYADFQLQFPSHFILMQVGDFFELYGEDAIKASRILDIGLTTAPNKISNGSPVAMTGVPVRSVDTYVERFIKAGHSVVLCEQVGQQASRRMDRRITRVITPGTLTEESLLESGCNNFLLAIIPHVDGYGLAWIDISTGYFRLGSCSTEDIADELVRINPREILLVRHPEVDEKLASQLDRMNICVHDIEAQPHDIKATGRLYDQIFSSAEAPFDHSLLSAFSSAELQASSYLLSYVLQTQLDKRPYIELPTVDDPKSIMRIDAASFKSLEVLKSNSIESSASLLSIINHTLTAAGSRLLSRWLQSPSTDIKLINSRLDLVQELIQKRPLLIRLRELLQPCKDLERCYQRLALNRASGGPRDMQLIHTTLTESEEIRKLLSLHLEKSPDSTLAPLALALASFDGLIEELSKALNDKLPYRVADGGVIREGYSERLDMLRMGTGDVRKARALLENKYRNETGKSTLRIDEGKLLGFFVEVSRSEGLISSENALFHFDGQTETKFRYRTTELNNLRDSSTVNEAKILVEESMVYERLREMIVSRGVEIIQTAKIIAELDVLCSFAHTAINANYVRPTIVESPRVFNIVDGRHPVVESIQSASGRPFTSNDCTLCQTPFTLITGPNMGGKSTFLRQNALIAILAQAGSFVPAVSAEIGIVNAIFTRIGASDDLAKDRSTFMMEMSETATILKHATARSLVIMDEIGRGTAAEEGFALAWAIVKHLLETVGCRTLFATHYYGLAALVQSYPSLAGCLQTTAQDDGQGGLTFLHKLIPGVASHSFAIEIGKFAGLPASVLECARIKLKELRRMEDELSSEKPEDVLEPTIVSTLHFITPDDLSPREAHGILSRLVDKATGKLPMQ